MRGRRVAWADMASDDSESEQGGGADAASDASERDEEAGLAAGEARPAELSEEDECALPEDPPQRSAGVGREDVEGAAAAGSSSDAAAWATQVQAAAEQLRLLVQAMPTELAVSACVMGTSTDLTFEQVGSLQNSAAALQQLQAEVSCLSAEVAAAEAEAERAERRSAAAEAAASEAASSVAARAAANEAADAKRRRCAEEQLAAAAALPGLAEAAAAAAAEEAARQAQDRQRSLDTLRQQAARQTEAAREARAAADRAAEQRQAALELPGLRQQRNSQRKVVDSLDQECSKLRCATGQLRSELETVQAGARAEALQARISQLEAECRELQGGAGEAPSAETVLQEARASAELQAAQEANRSLVTEVREVRAKRGIADSALEEAIKTRDNCKKVSNGVKEELVDLRKQGEAVQNQVALLCVDVAGLQFQIDEYERRVLEQEEAAKAARERNQHHDQEKLRLVMSKRQMTEAANVLEWRLQKAAARLDKERPGGQLAKCLLSLRQPAHLGTVARGPKAAPKRGSENEEVESTTAGGESVAEFL